MNKQDVIISLLKEIDKNIDNVNDSGGTNDKVKLSSLRVTNDLLDENGYWAAELVDVSNVISLKESFYQCSGLRILDVSNWNASNVKNMELAFAGCSQLQNLDVSQWDTNNVVNMNSMFAGCEQLQQFNGNNWDVRKVLNMSSMFINNKQILHLDLNNWNVDNVQIMSSMFANCNQLQLVEVGNWQTKSLTNASAMFRYDDSLQQLDLTNWDFSNAINITEMFFGCGALQSIVGGRTYKDVADNNIGCFNGLKIDVGIYTFYLTPLDHASLRAIINGLADLTGQTTKTLALGTTLIAKLTEEDIAIATAKNWTIA